MSQFRRALCGAFMLALSAVAQAATVTGTVKTEDGQAIAGATVRVQTTTLSTITDARGTFALAGVREDREVVLTAAASGFFIGGPVKVADAQAVTLELKRLPATDNPGYSWVSPHASSGHERSCESCHSRASANEAPLPYDEWLGDAHGLSARNDRFLSMYHGTDLSGLRQSPPTRFTTIADYGRAALPRDPSLPWFGPGYLLDFPGTSGECASCHVPIADMSLPLARSEQPGTPVADGITCDVCHKIAAVRINSATGRPYANLPGLMSYALLRPEAGAQLFFGPLDDVAPGNDAHSPLHGESRFCAGCHSGTFWGVQVYDSFGEWLDSPYSKGPSAQTCQDCHMPSRGQTLITRIENGGRIRDAKTIRSHLTRGPGDLQFLRSAASLDVTASIVGGILEVTAQVTNTGAGHSLPTDHPARNLLLVISAVDSAGNSLELQSGDRIPEWAGLGAAPEDYAGRPGRGFARILQETWTGVAPTASYWAPVTLQSDNRIGALQTDTSRYEFAIRNSAPVQVVARLIYRRAFRELALTKGWNDPDLIMQESRISLPE
jgi:hypothetical protein